MMDSREGETEGTGATDTNRSFTEFDCGGNRERHRNLAKANRLRFTWGELPAFRVGRVKSWPACSGGRGGGLWSSPAGAAPPSTTAVTGDIASLKVPRQHSLVSQTPPDTPLLILQGLQAQLGLLTRPMTTSCRLVRKSANNLR